MKVRKANVADCAQGVMLFDREGNACRLVEPVNAGIWIAQEGLSGCSRFIFAWELSYYTVQVG